MKLTLRHILTGLVTLGLPLVTMGRSMDNKRLYDTLDSLLEKQQSIVRDKEQRIDIIREGLYKKGLTQEERVQINRRLFDEYLAFRFDSAYHYIQQNIILLSEMNDVDRLVESQLSLSHILSVSGSHISLLAAVMAWLGSIFRLPMLARAVMVIATIAVYSLLAGLVPPVIRSALMGGLTFLALALDREKEAGRLLILTGLLMLTISPLLLYHISFQN